MAYPNPIDLGIVQKVSNGGSAGIATAANLTVPDGKRWDVRALEVSLSSSATVGNRRLQISVYDAAQLIFRYYAGITQAASLSYGYVFASGVPLSAAVLVDIAFVPFPANLVLGPGMIIKVADQAAVDAAADTYLQSALVVETGLG